MNLTTLFKLTYGIYIVSSKKDEKYNGCIVNSVFQVTAENPTIAISVAKANLTHSYIKDSGMFTVSILEKDTPLKFIGKYGFRSGKDMDKFENTKYRLSEKGIPIITENTLGYIEAEVISSVDVGTHTIFIGKILDTDNIAVGEPLTYAYYHQIKGGKSPKNAPTFAQQKSENEIKKQVKLKGDK